MLSGLRTDAGSAFFGQATMPAPASGRPSAPSRSSCLIFDPQTAGHHREYVRHLYAAFSESQEPQPKVAFHLHASIIEAESIIAAAHISVHPVAPKISGDGARLPGKSLALEQLRSLDPPAGAHVFFPRINAYLSGLATRPFLRADVSTSGILFSPGLAAWCHRRGSFRARLRACREVLCLRRLRSSAGLKRIFLLNDSRTAKALQRCLKLAHGVCSLADPVVCRGPLARRPEMDGLSPGSSKTLTFLLVGSLRPGKGILETLAAFQSWHPPREISVSLILAGAVNGAFATDFHRAVESFQPDSHRISLSVKAGFLSDEALDQHLMAADFLLVPYRNPLGSSGILGHAARSHRPALGTDAGLIGHLIDVYGLGHSFDVRSRNAWHQALDAAAHGSVRADAKGHLRYLLDNSVEQFQQSLREYLLEQATAVKQEPAHG